MQTYALYTAYFIIGAGATRNFFKIFTEPKTDDRAFHAIVLAIELFAFYGVTTALGLI